MGLFTRPKAKKPDHGPKSKKPATAEQDMTNELASRKAMGNADRELYQYELPIAERGMADLIDTYKEGNRFQYVALTGQDEETMGARVRRLVTLQPRVNKSAIPIDKLPELRLIGDTEQFSLDMAVPKKGKSYVRLAAVTVVFVPLMSAMGSFTKARVSILDTRLIGNQIVQSQKIVTNLPVKKEMTMDYCIPRESAGKIVLNIVREQALMEFGEQWGAVQLQLQMEESDFPYASNFKEVAGVVAVPPAVLEDYQVNPNHLDLSILEGDRKRLRDIYLNGDLADETEPIENKTAQIKYTKSGIGIKDQPKGLKAESQGLERPGWEMLATARKPMIPEYQVSHDPDSESEMDITTLRNTETNIENLRREWLERGRVFSGSTINSEADHLASKSNDSGSEVEFVPTSSMKRGTTSEKKSSGVRFESERSSSSPKFNEFDL